MSAQDAQVDTVHSIHAVYQTNVHLPVTVVGDQVSEISRRVRYDFLNLRDLIANSFDDDVGNFEIEKPRERVHIYYKFVSMCGFFVILSHVE